MEIKPITARRLRPEALAMLCMHKCGYNIKSMVCRTTYEKYKRLFESHGYDISKPVQQEEGQPDALHKPT